MNREELTLRFGLKDTNLNHRERSGEEGRGEEVTDFVEEIVEDLIVLLRILFALFQRVFHLLIDTSEEIPSDRANRRELLLEDLFLLLLLLMIIVVLLVPTEGKARLFSLADLSLSLSYRSLGCCTGGSSCTTSWVLIPKSCFSEVKGVGGVSDAKGGRGEELSSGLEGMFSWRKCSTGHWRRFERRSLDKDKCIRFNE